MTQLTKADIDGLEPRFANKVAVRDECWGWTGATNRTGGGGYGILSVAGRPTLTHRHAWQLVNGPIPCGMSVLHRCDNRPCIRPDHLFLGTKSDNMRDMVSKGRGWHPVFRGERSKWSRLTASDVVDIRRRKATGESSVSIAARYTTSDNSVNRIVRRARWAHLAESA